MTQRKLPVGFQAFAGHRDDSGGIFREWIKDEHGQVGPKEPFVNDEQCWAFAERVAAPFVEAAVVQLVGDLDQAMVALTIARGYLSDSYWCLSAGDVVAHEAKSMETCPVCADLRKIDAAIATIVKPNKGAPP